MSGPTPYEHCKRCGTDQLTAATKVIGICHDCIRDEQRLREKRAQRKKHKVTYKF